MGGIGPPCRCVVHYIRTSELMLSNGYEFILILIPICLLDIFLPGGSRCTPARRYTNLFVTMLLAGLWHGAGCAFIISGGLHRTYLCVNHAWSAFARNRAVLQSKPMLASLAGTFQFATAPFKVQDFPWIFGGALIAFFAPNTQQLFRVAIPARETNEPPIWKIDGHWVVLTAIVFVVAFFRLTGGTEFLYFQFR